MKQISLLCMGAIVGIFVAVMLAPPTYATCNAAKGFLPRYGIMWRI